MRANEGHHSACCRAPGTQSHAQQPNVAPSQPQPPPHPPHLHPPQPPQDEPLHAGRAAEQLPRPGGVPGLPLLVGHARGDAVTSTVTLGSAAAALQQRPSPCCQGVLRASAPLIRPGCHMPPSRAGMSGGAATATATSRSATWCTSTCSATRTSSSRRPACRAGTAGENAAGRAAARRRSGAPGAAGQASGAAARAGSGPGPVS